MTVLDHLPVRLIRLLQLFKRLQSRVNVNALIQRFEIHVNFVIIEHIICNEGRQYQ